MNKREKMYKRIEKHGNDLIRLFPDTVELDPIKLCKKLRTIELKAERITLELCNGVPSARAVAAEAQLEKIHDKICQILGVTRRWQHLFINRDPRGYALKLSEEFAQDKQIYKDWGGYGILAPDFGGEA